MNKMTLRLSAVFSYLQLLVRAHALATQVAVLNSNVRLQMEADLVGVAMAEWESGNISKAETLLLEAARAGNGHAAHNLGTLYAVGGPGVKAGSSKSLYWYEKALASGFEHTVSSDPTK